VETKHKIEIATKRNILDAFLVTKVTWYGDLEQTNFLGRLYYLQNLPSFDNRYKTAFDDIHKHTFLNNDWPDEWIFSDARFNLLHIQDNVFLDFLSLTIHPMVRDNKEQIVTLLEIFNNNLLKHGFEIVKSKEIAGKPVYEAREISQTVTNAAPKMMDKKLALVVGCSAYKYANSLINPLNDANGMENILQNLSYDVIKVIDPTQKELKVAIDDFGDKLKNYQVGLFYYAGHGVQVKGLNYIIPIDANLKSEIMVEYDCVEVNRALSYMEDRKTNVNIIILDACRDNPFERSWGRGIGLRGLATMKAPIG
jgi:hypothetical protein